ncbi:MAG: hypothetical protein ABIH18_07940 [Candidatus Omnitrophota bacterium]
MQAKFGITPAMGGVPTGHGGLLRNAFFVIAMPAPIEASGLVRAIQELAILVDKSFLDSPNKSENDRKKPFRNRLLLHFLGLSGMQIP